MNNDLGYGVLTNTDVSQIESSLRWIFDKFADKCHINLLEIGVHKGLTSTSVNRKLQEMGLKNYTYWAIDNQQVRKPFEECKLIIGSSEESFTKLPDELHWVFIDGCHCVNHIMLDFLNYGYKVVKDGLIVFHDTSPSAQGNHYQKHGPKISDFHIATEKAFDKLDIFRRKDWELVSNKYDLTREFGGVAIFAKIEDRKKTISYYSKEGQDKFVVETLKGREHGYFVDIGASNGISNNNTYALEKHLNWTGICVEPNPNMRAFPSLKEHRRCICENKCVYSQNSEVDFVNRGRKIETSGIYFEDASSTIHYLVEQKKHGVIKVPSITLIDLLKTHNAPQVIDYLSIDTEGSEWEILKDFDFSKYTFLVLTIENNYNPLAENCQKEKTKRDRIRELLITNGYILKNELYFGEDWFVHNTIS